MPVYKDKNGKWYVNTSYYEDGQRKYITKRGFTLKKQALEWEVLNKNVPETKYSNITYNDLMINSLEQRQAQKHTKHQTKRIHEMYMTDFLNKKYSSLTKPKINKWVIEVSKLKLSTTMKNNILTEFKSVCKYANDIYDLYDYGKHIKNFKYQIGEKKEMGVWSIDVFNQFIEYIDNYIMKALFTFLFFTGCRRGEALALHKEDIKNNQANIYKSYKRASIGVSSVKNEKSIRIIDLNKRTLSAIEPLLSNEGDYLFGGLNPLSTSTVDRYFKIGIQSSGVKPIRIHDLRHSHATILINQGINIVAVSRRLGHSDINMTLKVYTHLLENSNKDLIDYLNKL
ncbi:MAG: site-specific integrase [Erysipelotrichaceae bacterium]|nr:site-specific integrase [Erysipelotrichaceae bacterium]